MLVLRGKTMGQLTSCWPCDSDAESDGTVRGNGGSGGADESTWSRSSSIEQSRSPARCASSDVVEGMVEVRAVADQGGAREPRQARGGESQHGTAETLLPSPSSGVAAGWESQEAAGEEKRGEGNDAPGPPACEGEGFGNEESKLEARRLFCDIAMALEAHNSLRAMHGAPPLVWSDHCAFWAATCAIDNSQSGHMSHRFHRKEVDGVPFDQGQNIFWQSNKDFDDSEAVRKWYDEMTDPGYDFSTPSPQSGTGHFTQVVWKATSHVGMARSPCGLFVVANYFPPGNLANPGEYEANVLPPPHHTPGTRIMPSEGVQGGGDEHGALDPESGGKLYPKPPANGNACNDTRREAGKSSFEEGGETKDDGEGEGAGGEVGVNGVAAPAPVLLAGSSDRESSQDGANALKGAPSDGMNGPGPARYFGTMSEAGPAGCRHGRGVGVWYFEQDGVGEGMAGDVDADAGNQPSQRTYGALLPGSLEDLADAEAMRDERERYSGEWRQGLQGAIFTCPVLVRLTLRLSTSSLTSFLRLLSSLRFPPPASIMRYTEGLGVWTDWMGNQYAGAYEGGRKHGSGVMSFVPKTRADISAVYEGGSIWICTENRRCR